jgi:undecaprenyl-diphosphatase
MATFIDLDTWITFSIYTSLSNPFLDLVSFGLAILFSFVFLFSFLFLSYFIKRDKRIFLILFAILMSAVTVTSMKLFFARPRPLLNEPYIPLLDAFGYSFPSGHSALAFCAVTVFFYFNRRYGTIGFLVAALAAFSRVYVAAHYLSDVIAGSTLGVMVALICIRFSHRIYKVESKFAGLLKIQSI